MAAAFVVNSRVTTVVLLRQYPGRRTPTQIVQRATG